MSSAEYKIKVVYVTRCLSLTQPWATLVAIGAKKFETRSWSSTWRGALAIHAAKGFPKDCIDLCRLAPFQSALAVAGFRCPDELPRGKVIAVVYLADCVSTNQWRPDQNSNEYAFGNYAGDRFAWRLDSVQRIKPFDAKGSLGIWKSPRPITAEDVEGSA